MTDDIVKRLHFHAEEIINGREIEVIPGTYLVEAADDIERLRADMKELLEITKLFADEGKCREYEDEFGYCSHSSCDWHGAEHMWESFCMSRGI